MPKANRCNKRTTDLCYLKFSLHTPQAMGILRVWLKNLKTASPENNVCARKSYYENCIVTTNRGIQGCHDYDITVLLTTQGSSMAQSL